jgi:hypothetical protein
MMFTVMRSNPRACIGFVITSERGHCGAYDSRGISIGRFMDKTEATRAVYESVNRKATNDEN